MYVLRDERLYVVLFYEHIDNNKLEYSAIIKSTVMIFNTDVSS